MRSSTSDILFFLILCLFSFSTQIEGKKLCAVRKRAGSEKLLLSRKDSSIPSHDSQPRKKENLGNEKNSSSNENASSVKGNVGSSTNTTGLSIPGVGVAPGSIYVGVAVEEKYLASDEKYREIVKKYFQVLTPGNEMKWDATEKTQGVFSFAEADKIVQFAKQNGMRVRGHTAVWHKQVPQWLQQLDAQTLLKATQNHIQTVLKHFKNDVFAFDVCNEILGDDGQLRNSFWSQKLGDSFYEMAFRAASDVGTNVKLYINDYNVEGPGKKSDALYAIAKKLSSKKLLDGVGFQGHMIVGTLPSLEDLKSNLKRFVDLGLEVAYTEVDIRVSTPASSKDLAQKAKDFATMATACKETAGCRGLSVWGVTPTDSWVSSAFPSFGDAVLLDANYQPTQAFQSFEEALKGTTAV